MPKPIVSAVIIIVKTFQVIPKIAIEPTTHAPARPTGRITTRDWPRRLVKTKRTAIETSKLIAVDSTCEITKPEKMLWMTITSPVICTSPPIKPSISNIKA